HVLRRDSGVNLLQLLVIGWPQEGEGGGQSSRADARDQCEFGPGSRLGPAVQQAGTEGTVLATTGDRQEICRRQGTLVSGGRQQFGLAPERNDSVLPQTLDVRIVILPVSDVGHAADGFDRCLLVLGHGGQPFRRRATLKQRQQGKGN